MSIWIIDNLLIDRYINYRLDQHLDFSIDKYFISGYNWTDGSLEESEWNSVVKSVHPLESVCSVWDVWNDGYSYLWMSTEKMTDFLFDTFYGQLIEILIDWLIYWSTEYLMVR